MSDLRFGDRPLAFTDLETTGLEKLRPVYPMPGREDLMRWHEFCEIGLVVADQKTLEIKTEWSAKVRVEYPKRASPEALAVNGFTPEEWQNALPVNEALKKYNELTAGAIFVSQVTVFDWTFLEIAYTMWGLEPTSVRHRIDMPSFAYATLLNKGYGVLPSYSLRKVAEFLGIPDEPMPHVGIEGARQLHRVFKALHELESQGMI